MNLKSILSQFNGCFLNQTIDIPRYHYLFQDRIVEYSFRSSESMNDNNFSNEYFYGIWMVMFWLSFFSMCMFGYRLLENICCGHRHRIDPTFLDYCSFDSKRSSDVFFKDSDKDEQISTVVDDMRGMLNEISVLSFDERQERSERYYILTNLLVNRFRIEVYEKILK